MMDSGKSGRREIKKFKYFHKKKREIRREYTKKVPTKERISNEKNSGISELTNKINKKTLGYEERTKDNTPKRGAIEHRVVCPQQQKVFILEDDLRSNSSLFSSRIAPLHVNVITTHWGGLTTIREEVRKQR